MTNRKRVYVIEVITNGVHKISQEAYWDYDDAKKFIEKRSDNPNMVNPFLFKSENHEYYIHDMLIV